MSNKEINLCKIYQFPKEIEVVKYKGKNLIIYTEGVNWLVYSDEEYAVFQYLQLGKSIQETLNEFDQEIVVAVLTQIEAKQFESLSIYDNRDFNLCIYLTNRCNIRCEHCYMFSGEWEIEELPINVWKNVLKQFKDENGRIVTFTGGELLLYNQWIELLKYSKDLGLKVVLLSNGLLWTDKFVKEAYPYIDQIQISVDGHNEESYYKVRKTYGFKKALDTSISFANLGTKVSLAVTPLYEGLDNFIKYFKTFVTKFREENPNIQIDLSLELIPGRNVTISPKKNFEYRQHLKNMVNDLYPDYYSENFAANYIDTNKMSNCGFGGITIAPDGSVYWCNRIAELKSSYNVKSTSIKLLKQISEEIKQETSVIHVDKCSICPIKYICGGGCRLKYRNFADFNENNHSVIFQTECSQIEKNNFYNKMIESNEYFYSE